MSWTMETMDCTACSAALDLLIDGALEPAVVAEVEAHCAGCRDCARELAELRALREATAALPREIPPPAALWAAVAAHTTERRSARTPWPAWAAAATVVATLGGVTAVWLGSGSEGSHAPSIARAPQAGAAVPAVADPRMARRAYLVSDLTRRGQRVAPEATATVERNLKVIQQALLEIEAAVEANPNDANLRRLLTEVHIRESALIERMQRLSIDTQRRNDI